MLQDFDPPCRMICKGLSLVMHSFFCMTMIPNTLPVQSKHAWIEKGMMEQCMDWPPQSLDLNITEAALEHLDRKQKKKKQPAFKEDLWSVF